MLLSAGTAFYTFSFLRLLNCRTAAGPLHDKKKGKKVASEPLHWLKSAFVDELGSTAWTDWEVQRAHPSHFLESATQKTRWFWAVLLFPVMFGCFIPFIRELERHIPPSWAGSISAFSTELKKLSRRIRTILLKYHRCWKWGRLERGVVLNWKDFLLDGGNTWLSLDFQPLLASGTNLNLALEGEQILSYCQICQRFDEKSMAVLKRRWMNCLQADADAAFPRASLRFSSCNRDTRPDHPAFSKT